MPSDLSRPSDKDARSSEAAALEVRPSQYPQAEGITWFARALGAARSGDDAEALQGIERLRAIRDSLKTTKQDFWANQTEIQIRAASAWVEQQGVSVDEFTARARPAFWDRLLDLVPAWDAMISELNAQSGAAAS